MTDASKQREFPHDICARESRLVVKPTAILVLAWAVPEGWIRNGESRCLVGDSGTGNLRNP